jgi:uncharacterized membrane protein
VAGLKLKDISLAGLIAAIYTVLTLALAPFSFGVYQVRIAEALTVTPCLSRAAVPGLFVGCLLANWFGGLGYQDIIFGSLITLVAAMATRVVFRLPNIGLGRLLAITPALLLWAGGSALLWGNGLSLGIVTMLSGALAAAVLAAWLRVKREGGWLAITPLAVLVCGLLAAAIRLTPADLDPRVMIMGTVALVAAAGLTWWPAVLWFRGENPNVLIAPLPPVVFNAFGVSLYLAPILGFNYWFSVQMVGVGQLIACYLLGLPLLRVLESRRSMFDS